MIKYIQDIIDRLVRLQNGMDKNPDKWTKADETAAIKKADEIESSAIAYEKNDPVKLSLYGIALKKEKVRRPAPTSSLHPAIVDDSDGAGFVLSTNSDPVGDQYEWLKGSGADPTKTDLIPEMRLLKSTTKTSFDDDDVAKGVRYFYKVRAINAAGEGPWSEAVSKVQ